MSNLPTITQINGGTSQLKVKKLPDSRPFLSLNSKGIRKLTQERGLPLGIRPPLGICPTNDAAHPRCCEGLHAKLDEFPNRLGKMYAGRVKTVTALLRTLQEDRRG
jgi:hypothetical protein